MNSESFETASAERLPPHDLQSEQAIIGCCLLAPKTAIDRCCEKLPEKSKAFYDLRHQKIFQAILDMHDLGDPVDVVTLFSHLGSAAESLGGAEYLNQCEDLVPSAANLDYYLDVVSDRVIQRKILQACATVSDKVYAHVGSTESLVEILESDVLAVQAGREPKTALDGAQMARSMMDDLERRFKLDGKLSGIDTGLYDLNKMTEGLQRGEQFVVGARPSMGKTALGITIFRHCVFRLNIPALFISLEMSSDAIMRRILSAERSIPIKRLRSGRLVDSDFPASTGFAGQCKRSPMFLVEGVSGMTSREIAAIVRRNKVKHGIQLVIIDYMQKIHPDTRHEKRTYEIGDVSGKLKALAVETDVAMLTLAQINRENEKQKGRPPRASDLADSGQIERDADLIGLLHMDENNNRSLIIAKQRDGETGVVDLGWTGEFARFENVSFETP